MGFEQSAGRISWLLICVLLLPVFVAVFAWQEITGTAVPSSMTVRNQMDNFRNMSGAADSQTRARVLADIKEMQAKRMKAGYDPVYDCKLSENKPDRATYSEFDYRELDPLFSTKNGSQLDSLHDGFKVRGQPESHPQPSPPPVVQKHVTEEEMCGMTNELGRLNRELGDESLRLLKKQNDGQLTDSDMNEFYAKQAAIAKLKAEIDESTMSYDLSAPIPKQKLILHYMRPFPTNVVTDVARLKAAEKDLENDMAKLQKKYDDGLLNDIWTDPDVAAYVKKWRAVADFKKKVHDSLPITYIGPGGETQDEIDQRYREQSQQNWDEYHRENQPYINAAAESLSDVLGSHE